jgi:hypothetical protein
MQVTIRIRTKETSTPLMAQEISYHNRFLIEYALLEKVPPSVEDAVRLITADNRQEHKLFLASSGRPEGQEREDRSGISNQYSYRTVHDEQEFRMDKSQCDRDRYEGMTGDQKSQYLDRELGRLEKEKTDLLMTNRPRPSRNVVKILLVFLMAVIVGNLVGRWLGVGRAKEEVLAKEMPVKKKEEWNWYGLAHYWRKPEPEPAPAPEKSWW